MIASCGHEVEEGITCSVTEDDGVAYRTLCMECLMDYYREHKLLNQELKDLILMLRIDGYRICNESLVKNNKLKEYLK